MWDVVIYSSIAVGTASMTIAQARVMEPVRCWVMDHWAWGGKLISCPYCVSHWLAGLLCWWLYFADGQPHLLDFAPADWLVQTFATVGLSCLTMKLLFLTFWPEAH